MILHRHTQSTLGLSFQFSADAAHAQNAEEFPLRVMTQRRGGRAAAPGTGAQGVQRGVEEAEGAEKEEEGSIGGGGINGGGRVGDIDSGGRAGGNVNLIVPGACEMDDEYEY
jgi:hypothetical protein